MANIDNRSLNNSIEEDVLKMAEGIYIQEILLKNKIKKFIKKITRINFGIFHMLFFLLFQIILLIYILFFSNFPKSTFISFLLMFIGGCCNFLCIFFNDYKMPAYEGPNDLRHFKYTDKRKIKLWYLSDFIVIFVPHFWRKKNERGKYGSKILASIGDILLFVGFIGILL